MPLWFSGKITNMNIQGIGIVFARGRGRACFENALEQGWREPTKLTVPGKRNNLAYLVDIDAVKDKNLKIRRADKFSKMAVLAASDALQDSPVDCTDKARLGVVLASAYGPHVTTFDFLDGFFDYGDTNVSPTAFSNSVHNAASSYITQALEIHGPSLTITQFHSPFQHALLMAELWLNEGHCDYCLVGAVDQYGEVLGYIQNHKLPLAGDGKIKPFNFKPTCQVPGEGAVFFLVGRDENKNSYCKIDDISFNRPKKSDNHADLNIIDTNGLLSDESAYLSTVSSDIPTAAYAPLFGSMLIVSAFNMAAGALMLKNQLFYSNPVTDNPHGINLLQNQECSNITDISCVGYDCDAESSVVHLIGI